MLPGKPEQGALSRGTPKSSWHFPGAIAVGSWRTWEVGWEKGTWGAVSWAWLSAVTSQERGSTSWGLH